MKTNELIANQVNPMDSFLFAINGNSSILYHNGKKTDWMIQFDGNIYWYNYNNRKIESETIRDAHIFMTLDFLDYHNA